MPFRKQSRNTVDVCNLACRLLGRLLGKFQALVGHLAHLVQTADVIATLDTLAAKIYANSIFAGLVYLFNAVVAKEVFLALFLKVECVLAKERVAILRRLLCWAP